MADILIKNMEMPETCNKCFIDHRKCEAYQRQVERIANSKTEQIFDVFGEMRLKSCPLVSLPEHGDLKDANAILRWLNAKADNRVPVTLGEIIDFIEKQPTVLEASE